MSDHTPDQVEERVEERIERLLSQMTLEEKASLTAGADFWTTVPLERLGIPPMKVTDGPNGARGGDFSGGVSAACFPVGIALAATWDPDLIYRIGVALAEEAKSKGASVLLGPTVNMHRSPLNGRNFECYSEDPYLASRIAVAYVKGVQSQKVGTSIKHFVCNDSEFERMSISSEVGERALREIYLPPFRAAVEEAGTWSVMSGYNRVNGVHCSENTYTLQDILKGEWGFDGFVVSDWTGTRSTIDSANNGLDLEMPGPAVWMGGKLVKAVQNGQVSEDAIDDKVRRLLRIMIRTGALDAPGPTPEEAIDKPEHRHLIRQAGAEGTVLLKNDGVLPLDEVKIKRLAIIGPNAKDAKIMGGGSAHVVAHYVVTPFDGVTVRAGEAIEVVYHVGCASFRTPPLIPSAQLTPAGGAGHGLTVEYFANLDLADAPVFSEVKASSERIWLGDVAADVDKEAFSARLSGTFTPVESGSHTFCLMSAGLSRLYIDGQEVIDNWDGWQPGGEGFFGAGGQELTIEVEMTAGQAYELHIDYSCQNAPILAGVRLGLIPPLAEDSVQQAATLAAESDVALLFVGLGSEWDSEGNDRPDMDLPPEQVALIEAVAAANPKTVVVLNTGSPITMDWLDQVAAVVQAWYPGQECGNAIADVLFGDGNPCGKLPQTFPRRLQDNPAYINYPGEEGRVYYGEGIFIGYRYYDKKDIEPLFPFGYGLSYTTFEYGNLVVGAAEYESPEGVRVSVDVTNTGARAGKEVVQLYVRDVASTLVRPEKELKAFQKVWLEPGETKTVTFELSYDALAYYTTQQKGWLAEAGQFEVLVGSSARDIRARGTFTLTQDELVRVGAVEEVVALRLGLDTPLGQLLANEEAKAILVKRFPDMMDSPQLAMGMGFSLEQIAGFAPQIFTEEVMQSIAEELAQLAPVAAAEVAAPRLSLVQRLLMKLAQWRARRSAERRQR